MAHCDTAKIRNTAMLDILLLWFSVFVIWNFEIVITNFFVQLWKIEIYEGWSQISANQKRIKRIQVFLVQL